ncbi:flagellar motor protein MotB [Bacillus sp. V3B]|uniref:flagellar motor protein MotB n=1 Tax=Bacillus sp. V3B TaxID=2804915 RepID=UPI002108DF13|nr:flagellar motor protein MotB [Bacillus sp. V3B]MCQ6275198.1 flagellar motor protein MotB [Bacillus sp. V3B]
MSRRRKKKHHEEHIDESWLLPYSDLLTLLVALFIVLFASSAIDSQKFESLSNAFNAELNGGTGVFNFPSPIPEVDVGETDEQEEETDKQEEETEDKEDSESIPEYTAEQLAEFERVKEIQERINVYIEENGLGNQLETSLTFEGLSITIRDNVLFAPGSADVRQEDIIIANEISKLLEMDIPRSIIVSGHTDNVPMNNAEFGSNWELSVMRAVNFMKILLKNENLHPELFSSRGNGEFQPIASNDTAEGRSQNRRVEILILPRMD